MKKFYTQGGGKFEYSTPKIETIEVSTEKGFATSTDVEGSFGTPEGVGDGNNDWWS